MKLFSSRSSHAAKKRGAKKLPTAAIAIFLVVIMAIGGTVAYLMDRTDSVINTFKPASSGITIEEEVKENCKTEIAVNNTGDVGVYVRVSLVANYYDKDGNITGAANVSDKLKGSDWTKLGDYYYYNGIVQAGGETSNLLNDEGIDLTGIQVTVLASAIQVEPADAVIEAWGVQFNNGAWTTASGT